MKKLFAIVISMMLVLFSLTGCSSNNNDNNIDDSNDKIKIVTTIFPEYDWVKEIIKGNEENIDIQMLLKNGADLHTYQASASDMLSISTADLFIYNGGFSDKWVDKALNNVTNENIKVINLFDVLKDDLKPIGGLNNVEEDIHEHDHDEHEHHHEFEEHTWTSLRNAYKAVSSISDALISIDNEHADLYRKNTEEYLNELKELDQKYMNVIENAKFDTLLFADRFPFLYLIEDYGLHYYSAFAGCSSESEASFETIANLAHKVDELGLNYVMVIENSKNNIAQTIIDNTTNKNQEILELNSLQSIIPEDIAKGVNYLDVMKSNLKVLEKALN